VWPIPVLSTQPTCSLTYEIQYAWAPVSPGAAPYVPIWAALAPVESVQRRFRIDGRDVCGADQRPARALLQEGNELAQRRCIALRPRLDRPIWSVPYPADQPELACYAHHGVAIADTLNATGDRHGDRLLIRHDLHRRRSQHHSTHGPSRERICADMGGGSIVRRRVRCLGSRCLKQGESMRSLSTALWFTIGSGLFVGWLGIIFAISEGSGMSGAVAVAAAGVTFGLLGIAMAIVLNR